MKTPRSAKRRRQQGFTFIEVMLAAVIGVLAVGVAVQSSATADSLAAATRVLLHSAAKHRKNQRALAGVLRSADESTLAAFDATGVATKPEFQRVTGQAYGQRTLSDVHRLEWRIAEPDPHPGGSKRLGGVFLVLPDASSVLVARDVQQNSFYVRREGRNLVVGLSTTYIVDASEERTVSSESVVTLRN